MAIKPADTEDSKRRVTLTWNDIYGIVERCWDNKYKGLAMPEGQSVKIYGIPRGGIYVALAFKARLQELVDIVESPEDADIFVDDIRDSGKTAETYKEKFGTSTLALYDAQQSKSDYEYLRRNWIVFPWEEQQLETGPKENIRRIIEFIGDDPNREGLIETPDRVLRSYKKIFGGYGQRVEDVLKVFEEDSSDEMVLLKNIEFYSTCEHHMIPFHGKAHIAYIPDGKVIGISKLARILEVFARRLQIQDRLCAQITSALMEHLQPRGAACIMEAQHFCMTSRGVEKQHSVMTTSSLQGVFKTMPDARAELLNLIKG
jgi:GTP cyclohydrolase I